MISGFAEVNGIRLHYVEEGSGKILILLHGFPEFWYGWRKQIPVLSRHFRVIAPDLRGYNLSDKPAGIGQYKLSLLAKDIAALIDVLGGEKVYLAGHDWGGAVAWAVATLYPDRIDRLAVLNIPHPLELRRALINLNIAQWKRSYYIFLFQLPGLPEHMMGKDLKRFFKGVFKNISPDGQYPVDPEIQEYVTAFSKPGAITASINYYRAALQRPDRIDFSKPLPMPVLMLWGEKDKALGKELTLRTKIYCENLDIIYDPQSGHFIQNDNAELVNKQLLKFFS